MLSGSRGLWLQGEVRVFDDWGSLVHFLAAFLLAFFSPAVSIGGSVVYCLYQVYDRDDDGERLGDLIEWLAGLVVGAAARFIYLGGIL